MKIKEDIIIRPPHREKNHLKTRLFIFGALVFCLLALALFSGELCPYDPYAQNLSAAKESPSLAHWLGTDAYGRDMLSRVLIGSQASLFSTLLLVVLTALVGSAFGLVCGWNGGSFLDNALMRLSDVFLAFPGLVFALAVAGVMGGGVQSAIFALAAIRWPKYARLSRALTISQKEAPYLAASKIAGCTPLQQLYRHVLPNIAGLILVTAVSDIGAMMMELAGLSFLGLGVKPPAAEWGSMMASGRSLLQTAPWLVLGPGAAIFIAVTALNLLGDAVRDYLDPRQRG